MWKISLEDLLQLAPTGSCSIVTILLLGGASLSWEAEPGRLESPKANSGTFLV